MQNMPPETRAAPGRSSLGFPGAPWRCSKVTAPATAMPAKIRFTYRHQRQDTYSVSIPPSSSPIAPPVPATAPYTPKARPRSLGSLNVTASSDSADGASKAPNAPWQARAATSMAKFTAAPPAADAAANPIRPATNVTFRPSRSASLPPRSSRLPNASAYAVTTHCRSTMENARSCCAVGSAMFMIVASSTIMSCARAITPRISHRCSGAAGLASAGWVMACPS